MKLFHHVGRCINKTIQQRTHRLAALQYTSTVSRNQSIQFARSFSIAHAGQEHLEPVDPSSILRPEGLEHARKQFSLVDALPGLPTLKPASQLRAPQTEITTLPNGMRVISHETYGQAATVGVFINAGSRCETSEQAGVVHALEHFGFKSTTSRPHAQLVREVEDIGAVTTASCGREQIIYTIDVLRDNVEKAVELLADAVLNVSISSEEFEQVQQIMAFQTENVMEDPQALVLDAIHTAAYGSEQALGRRLQCPLDQIEAVTLEKVMKFRQQHFVANNMIVAGSGMDHATLCALVTKLFGSVATSTRPLPRPVPAIYHGGMTAIEKKDSEFSYVAMAFPTHGGWHDKDLVPVCVLHTLLGGGDSFSAGGPGKGMYSRLYTHVLNRYYWVESAFSFSSIHEDVGLLGIYAACDPQHTSNLVALVCNQLYGFTQTLVNEIELKRAKNQLKSSVLMNLESRMILYEDIGRQLLTYGYRESPESVCAKIDAVTAQDLQRVMQQAMMSRPSMVIHGDVDKFPSYQQVCDGLQGAKLNEKKNR